MEGRRTVLSVIGDYKLWTYTETVDGKQVTHPLTVAGLFLVILVGVVTAVAVRNVGALLDIVLLQRLEMQADATYAIKVVTRYALTAAGVLVASSILGIGWSDVQWLVAASAWVWASAAGNILESGVGPHPARRAPGPYR
jgi:potassium efflux system protein